jgi:hypothetical protein
MTQVIQIVTFLITRAEQKWNEDEGVSAYDRKVVADLLSELFHLKLITRVEMSQILLKLEEVMVDHWD